MNPKSLFVFAIGSAAMLLTSAYAQTMPDNMPNNGNRPHHGMMIQDDMMQQPDNLPTFNAPAPHNPSGFGTFPTPDELSRLVPPEPLTEEKIKQRFANQREILQKAIDQDRKRAEQYARDFARYQKYQAEQLANIMAKAEQQREQMLKRLDQREQRVLENFRQRHQPVEASKVQ